MVDEGKYEAVSDGDEELGTLGGQRQQNARGQGHEKHGDVDEHCGIHCIVSGEILRK